MQTIIDFDLELLWHLVVPVLAMCSMLVAIHWVVTDDELMYRRLLDRIDDGLFDTSERVLKSGQRIHGWIISKARGQS